VTLLCNVSHTPSLYDKSKRKRNININIDLAILLSYDNARIILLSQGENPYLKDSSYNNLSLLQVQVNKKNSIEFSLDFVYYLYNYYMVYALLFHAYYVTLSYDII